MQPRYMRGEFSFNKANNPILYFNMQNSNQFQKCGIEFCWLCEDYKANLNNFLQLYCLCDLDGNNNVSKLQAETTSAIYEHLQKSHEYNVLFDLPDPNNDFNVQALGDY